MFPFDDVLIQLHPNDPIAIAKSDLQPNTQITLPGGDVLAIRETIPTGHKASLKTLEAGQIIFRYGYPIGQTISYIPAGSWVHTHNVSLHEETSEYSWQVVKPIIPILTGRTFMGYDRPYKKAGTRNYIAVISTVSCSAHVTSQIARDFPNEALMEFPNVDGVIPILHGSGCSLPPGGLSYTYLKRSLTNLAHNPNVAAVVYVGLGCEVMQWEKCHSLFEDHENITLGLVIQEQGGFENTVKAGIKAVRELLPQVNLIERTEQPLSNLVIALQCGGSDGWSGVTANPLIGQVVDQLVSEGGTAVLAETPEIFGAEQLLLQRVSSAEVGRKLVELFQWWSAEARRRGFSVDNNTTPGNKNGGLTTIYEKSLGAVTKAGSTPLNGVYNYAELIDRSGLVFMDTPGNDPISITGQLAGGCNLILFTTGRGTVYGSAIAPCIKIASNNDLYKRLRKDMDFNAGKLLKCASWEIVSDELLDLLVATASGKQTTSETHGLSESEFVPWQPDPVL